MKRAVALTIVIAVAVGGLVIAWMTVRQDREFRRLIAEGDAAIGKDQSFVAIEAFSGALALRPTSMIAHVKRGDAYQRRGEMEAALRDLKTAAALDPSATRPRELLGDVALATGRFDQAIDEYRAFIALDDHQPRAFYKLALTHYRTGQCPQAIEPLRQSISLDGRFAEAYYLLALCQRTTPGADAKQSLARAIELQPSFASAREELAQMLIDEGHPLDAVKELEELATLEPNRAERAVAVGLALAKAGRIETAIVRLGRAAEQHPQEPAVYTALGRVWLDIAQTRRDAVALSKAREALAVSAAATPPTSERLALYGQALLLAGDVRGAERTLDQAITHFPVDPRAFLYLSRAAARLGRIEKARDALIDYVNLSTDAGVESEYAKQIIDLSLRVKDQQTAREWSDKVVREP